MGVALRIAVTGGRELADRFLVYSTLDSVLAKHPGFTLVHGAAPGADALSSEWATSRKVPLEPHPADWDTHGKAAGPQRNQRMVDSHLDGCVAFPGNRGTADMVARCKKAGVPVWDRRSRKN